MLWFINDSVAQFRYHEFFGERHFKVLMIELNQAVKDFCNFVNLLLIGITWQFIFESAGVPENRNATWESEGTSKGYNTYWISKLN